MAGRATTPREWAIALVAGLGLSAVLVTLLRGGDAEAPAVEVTSTPIAPPAPFIKPPVPFVAPPPAAVAAVAATGFRLRGVIARPGAAASAIIEGGDGRQRLVRIGIKLAPGLVVTAIDAGGLTLAGAGGDQRLDFGDRRSESPAATASAMPETTDVATLASLAASISDYRTGLDPRKIDGLTRGFTLVDASRLPLFRKAGLQAGDVILMVNGTAIDSEEKVMELPAEINGAKAVEILYERSGKRETASIPIAR
jgi:general secretion pathway protein C